MPSRPYIIHTVSNVAPPGSRAGDEYYNPTTNTLYKDLVANGSTPGFNQVIFVNNSGIATVNGAVSATGNVTGNYILGNGALLTGVITSVANINNGTSNVTVVSSGGNITVGVGGIANIVQWATTGEYVTGVVSASGNVTGANINTAGLVSATGNVYGNYFVAAGQGGTISGSGNITGGNILTGGLISATSTITSAANIVGGNITTVGLVTATGNITGGNLLTGGLISATANVTAAAYYGPLANTTSNININTAAGNIAMTVGGVANVAVFSNTGAYLTLATGNTTVVPLRLANTTTVLATPTTGSIEYANSQLYFTPFAGNRAVVSTPFFYRTGATANTTNVATGQAWLGVGVTLNANTTYAFRGQFNFTTTNTTSHIEQVGFGGTATLANIYYSAIRMPITTAAQAPGGMIYLTTNALSNLTTAVTTAQTGLITIEGTVSTIAAGTFIPQWATNVAISTTGQFLAGAYFRIEPIAQGNTTVSVGVWA
jgi:hypothetical protein